MPRFRGYLAIVATKFLIAAVYEMCLPMNPCNHNLKIRLSVPMPAWRHRQAGAGQDLGAVEFTNGFFATGARLRTINGTTSQTVASAGNEFMNNPG